RVVEIPACEGLLDGVRERAARLGLAAVAGVRLASAFGQARGLLLGTALATTTCRNHQQRGAGDSYSAGQPLTCAHFSSSQLPQTTGRHAETTHSAQTTTDMGAV